MNFSALRQLWAGSEWRYTGLQTLAVDAGSQTPADARFAAADNFSNGTSFVKVASDMEILRRVAGIIPKIGARLCDL